MSQVVVRSAVLEDAASIIDLVEGGALPESPHPPSALAEVQHALSEILASECCDVLVAELDGHVVGTAQLITFRHVQHRGSRCAEIESMHVDEAHRSAGIGAALLDALVEAAQRRGCYRIQLTSNKLRPDAHRFYTRHGFEATHEGFKRYLDG